MSEVPIRKRNLQNIMPSAFMAGVMARQTVFSVREGLAADMQTYVYKWEGAERLIRVGN